MLERAREIYRRSKKRNDNFWTEWISRPPAALVVQLLEPTPLTPNQVTFLSLGAFVAAMAVLLAWPTHLGLVVVFCLTQFSYILDCVDGQLARLKSMSSPAGALLDFLMDEIKAFLLVGGVAARLWLTSGATWWLLVGIGGLVVVATGIALTTFMRRPEYLEAVGAPPLAPATDRGGHAPRSLSPVALVEAAGRYALHYPSWIIWPVVFDRLDWFLYIYLGAHFLYLGRASLTVLLKLGRPARKAAAPTVPTTSGEAS